MAWGTYGIRQALTHAANQHHAQEVAGPYRSQSSVPAVRAAATQHEHRTVNPFDAIDPPAAPAPHAGPLVTALHNPTLSFTPTAPAPAPIAPDRSLIQLPSGIAPDPNIAYVDALTHGVHPAATDRASYLRDYGPGVYGQIDKVATEVQRSKENLKQPADLTNLALLLATAGGSTYLGGALKAGEAGAGAAEGTGAEAAAQGGALGALKKAATFPLRHPFVVGSTPVAAEVPGAIASGDPRGLAKGLEGKGIAAAITNAASGAVANAIPGVAGHAIGDLLSLPAQVLPSAYLTARAGVNAAAGNPAELDQLRTGFQNTSALAALAYHQDPAEALKRFGEHPVYTGLEALGLKAAAGELAGRLGRRLGGVTPDRVGGAGSRPDLQVYGGVRQERDPYSTDLFKELGQRRRDAKREPGPEGTLMANPREQSAHLRSAVDREVFASEQVRRGNQRQVAHEVNEARPANEASANAARLAIEGIARDPARAHADLEGYKKTLIEHQAELPPSFLASNKQLVEKINEAQLTGDPHQMFAAADAYARIHAPITAELQKLGLISEHRAEKAIEIPYARTHMGAGHGLSRQDQALYDHTKGEMSNGDLSPPERGALLGRLSRLRAKAQTLDRHGDPLSLEQIREHMDANGVTHQHGYVSQQLAQAGGPKSFFAPPGEHPTLPSAARTGAATSTGAFDPHWESVVDQAIHSQTILDRARNFRHLVHRFGLRSKGKLGFTNYSEASHAAEHPEDFGIKLPDVPGGWVPVRTSPWLAPKGVVDATSKLGANEAEAIHPSDEGFSAAIANNALQPGDGPAILIPKVVADRMRHHYAEQLPLEKGAQAVTGAFKGTVLPTSPAWLTGNAADNYVVRAFGTGITPGDMRVGHKFADIIASENGKQTAARALESMTPGGLYGSYARIQPYRALEQFVGTKLEPFARAAHAVLTTPGPKQVADLYRTYRDAVFEFDSKYIETYPQYGQLAKSARRELDMTRGQFRRAVAAMDPVVTDLAKGFRNPETVDRFAKSVESVFGNWGKSGPEARRFLTTWAPFWMWARAATKFAFVTLPRDHPVLTGLIAASQQMTREERTKLGFAFDSEGAHEPLPDFLQTGIPDPWHPGGVVKLSNLTTYGTFADYPKFLASVPAPQFSSSLFAALGFDWKLDKLKKADGSEADATERAKAAILTGLEGFLPFLNTARAISAHGPGGLNPIKTYDAEKVQAMREPKQSISVPLKGSGSSSSSSSNPFDALGHESSANPFDALEAGEASANPFDTLSP